VIAFLLPVNDQYLIARIAMILDIGACYYLKTNLSCSEFKPLDPFTFPMRLAVMSLLISVEEAECYFLKEKTVINCG